MRFVELIDEASKKRKVPRYVQKLILRRTRLSLELKDACSSVDDYCEKIGLTYSHPLYEDAVLSSDVRIFCEEDAGHFATLDAIEKVLEERRK